MASTLGAILMQSSVRIYDVAARKVKSYISGRILECKVSGKIAASLAKCVVRIRPQKGLELFLPYICDQILSKYIFLIAHMAVNQFNVMYLLVY